MSCPSLHAWEGGAGGWCVCVCVCVWWWWCGGGGGPQGEGRAHTRAWLAAACGSRGCEGIATGATSAACAYCPSLLTLPSRSLEGLPLYGLGVSVGGSFVMKLPQYMRMDGVLSIVLGPRPAGWLPQKFSWGERRGPQRVALVCVCLWVCVKRGEGSVGAQRCVLGWEAPLL